MSSNNFVFQYLLYVNVLNPLMWTVDKMIFLFVNKLSFVHFIKLHTDDLKAPFAIWLYIYKI